jgi:hypothetical protein
MKFIIKSAAAAVSLALISVSAHAGLPAPAQATTTYPSNTGLYVAVFNSAGAQSEVVNLGYTLPQVNLGSGNLTPSSATSPFVQTTAPSGSGTVLQLNFGTISGFGSLFTSANAATTDFMVLAAQNGGAGTEQFVATASTTPTTQYSGVSGIVGKIQSEIADWAAVTPATGDLKDSTGSQPYSVDSTATLNDGTITSGQNFSGALNTAVGFYNITTTAARSANISAYNNGVGSGYWYLSSSGDLSYNIPVTASSVPLPAAVWLLGSGLLGIAGIGRRRAAA